MIIAFVPCRLKSSRLPNKAIEKIHGISAIERCLLNTLAIEKVDRVILATSTNPEDDILEQHTLGGKVELVRGSEEDVLDRFIPSILKYQPDYVMRITGDCPLVSYEMADNMILQHQDSGADVTITNSKIALGTAGEVYSTKSILKLREYFPHTGLSEYLIWYFLSNPKIFKVNQVAVDQRFVRKWRLTLDEDNDLKLFRMIFETLDVGSRAVSFDEVEMFFRDYPEARLINEGTGIKYKDNQELIARLKAATSIELT